MLHTHKIRLWMIGWAIWLVGGTLDAAETGGGMTYVERHAADPVKWQIWRAETLQSARQQDRPLFISSGYQACYWCYRMHRDVFSRSSVAELLNRAFVPVLIDRDRMPDVDLDLRRFAETVNGQAGWPMNVILTPDGIPVLAGTYQDAEAMESRLRGFLQRWQTQSEELRQAAEQVAATLSASGGDKPAVSAEKLTAAFLEHAQRLADHEAGGFTRGAKFPQVPALNALMALYQRQPDEALAGFLRLTLEQMARGSLRDAVNGGFFRYTADRQWRRPHYEKMLYTQAMLARLYIEAGLQFGRADWVAIGVDTVRFARRAFLRQDGLYASALASVGPDGREGGYYLWSKSQLQTLLTPTERASLTNLLGDAAELWLPGAAGGEQAGTALTKLREARRQEMPERDDKVVAAWNGLMLSALVYAAPFDHELSTAADALARKLMAGKQGGQFSDVTGQIVSLEDRVFLAQGLVHWASANADRQAKDRAAQWLQQAIDVYWDDQGWRMSDWPSVYVQSAGAHLKDSDLPSPSATWLALAQSSPQPDLRQMADSWWSRLTTAELDEAFFHAGLVAALATEPPDLTGVKASE